MTATVVLGPAATREEWLAARCPGVTGTDISAILGANPWATPLDIWLDKTGRGREVHMNDAMRRGTDLEPTIVKWAHRHLEEVYGGRWWVEYEGLPKLVAHPDRPLLLGRWTPWRIPGCDVADRGQDREARRVAHRCPVALRRPSPVVPRGVRPRPRPARGVRRDG